MSAVDKSEMRRKKKPNDQSERRKVKKKGGGGADCSQKSMRKKKTSHKSAETMNRRPTKGPNRVDNIQSKEQFSMEPRRKKEQEQEKEKEKPSKPQNTEQYQEFVDNPEKRKYTDNRNPGALRLLPEQMKSLRRFVQKMNEQGVEGLLAEFETIKHWNAWTEKENLKEITVAHHCYPDKNRYKDVFCLDSTRIKLEDGKGNDYINANMVQGDPYLNKFICTQGPLASTMVDFWRMVVQEKVGYIIMLCELVELGKKKCEKYFPDHNQSLEFGDIKVTAVMVDVTLDVQFIFSTFIVESPGNPKRVVFHWQWKNWPDRGTPQTALAALRALRQCRASEFATIIHCSAGVGRTGTLVAAEYVMQHIVMGKDVNMVQMVKDLRMQRAHAIQTGMQYAYVVLVVYRLLTIYARSEDEDNNKQRTGKLQEDLDYQKFSQEMKRLGSEIPRAQGGTAGPAVAVAGGMDTTKTIDATIPASPSPSADQIAMFGGGQQPPPQ